MNGVPSPCWRWPSRASAIGPCRKSRTLPTPRCLLAGDVAISDGTITLADQLGNGEVIDAIEKSLTFFPPLEVTGQYRLSLLGFELHFITFANDTPAWRIEFSLLIPASIMMLGAAIATYKYRKVRKATSLAEKPVASSEPAAHPLD